jgi:predicted membrane protein
MLRLIKSLSVYAWIIVNARNLIRIWACLLVIFIVNVLYEKWETALLAIYPEFLLWLLILYTLIVIIALCLGLFFLNRCTFLKKPERAIEAKKSFIDKPEEFESIRSVKLRPKLRFKSDSLTK